MGIAASNWKSLPTVLWASEIWWEQRPEAREGVPGRRNSAPGKNSEGHQNGPGAIGPERIEVISYDRIIGCRILVLPGLPLGDEPR